MPKRASSATNRVTVSSSVKSFLNSKLKKELSLGFLKEDVFAVSHWDTNRTHVLPPLDVDSTKPKELVVPWSNSGMV
jgi:hypothetical protein